MGTSALMGTIGQGEGGKLDMKTETLYNILCISTALANTLRTTSMYIYDMTTKHMLHGLLENLLQHAPKKCIVFPFKLP